MGWGDFGSNGSVHWRVFHDEQGRDLGGRGVDTNKKHPKSERDGRPVIGAGKEGKPEHPRKIRLIARYQSSLAAYWALAIALFSVRKAGDSKYATVFLDVDVWSVVRDEKGAFEPPEVSVDW